MDLRILTGVGSAALPTNGVARPGIAAGAAAGKAAAGGPSFANALDSALKSVSTAQNEAAAMQRNYQLGATDASLEDTMVAMQKAQIGFQAALTVRNRLVSAYSDIMNMQV